MENVHKKKKSHILLWILACIVICATIFVMLLLHHKVFNIKYVRVIGNDTIPSNEVIEKLGDMNRNIFRFSEKEAISKISDIKGVKNVEVEKSYPNRIVISLEENYILAFYEKNDKKYYFDKNGLCVEGNEENYTDRFLPIAVDGKFKNIGIGNLISSDERILQLLSKLRTSKIVGKIKKVNFEKIDNIDIMYKDIIVHFGSPDDLINKIKVLEAVIDDIEAKKLDAVEIILNEGSNPIVVTKEKEDVKEEKELEEKETETEIKEEE